MSNHYLIEPATNLLLIGRILLGIWFTAFGSCAGSFLNVVIYRWPAGLSVVNPRSRCPHCLHHVRWFDNIPILNWFWLRGRCRDCSTPIPFRYPAIELLVASIFLGLYLLYVINLGRTLPSGWDLRSDEEMIYQLIGLLTYHATFLTITIASVMIRFDGHRLPIQLILFATAVGLIAVSVWPYVHPVPIRANLKLPMYLAGLGSALAGLGTGFGMGMLITAVAGMVSHKGPLATAVFELSLCGLFLGWQAVLVIGLLTLAGQTIQRLGTFAWPLIGLVPVAAWVPFLSCLYLVLWRQLALAWPFVRGL